MITRKQYVDRLEKMLNSVDDVCATCPARRRFMRTRQVGVTPITQTTLLKAWSTSFGRMNYTICDMCRDFVDLNRYIHSCPCFLLINRKANPRQTAHDAIKRYRNDTHKWNKEGKDATHNRS